MQAKMQLSKWQTALRASEHDGHHCPPQTEWEKDTHTHTHTLCRVALVLQSQAGNLCSKTDTEPGLSILWIKHRIKGSLWESADKMFKARTKRNDL